MDKFIREKVSPAISSYRHGICYHGMVKYICYLFSVSFNRNSLTDVFMKTRFNLHNRCFLASWYHDLWDMPRIDNFEKQDLHLSLPR